MGCCYVCPCLYSSSHLLLHLQQLTVSFPHAETSPTQWQAPQESDVIYIISIFLALFLIVKGKLRVLIPPLDCLWAILLLRCHHRSFLEKTLAIVLFYCQRDFQDYLNSVSLDSFNSLEKKLVLMASFRTFCPEDTLTMTDNFCG